MHLFLSPRQYPQNLSSLLQERGSLTLRLQREYHVHACVIRLRQAWQMPLAGEAVQLGLRTREHAWVREIILLMNDQPLVFARSVAPRRTLCGHFRHLRRLGTVPLGTYLFTTPHIERAAMRVRCYAPSGYHYRAASIVGKSRPALFWGRESLFLLRHQPMLVTEIFLPDCHAQI